jgi:hypothetical protein
VLSSVTEALEVSVALIFMIGMQAKKESDINQSELSISSTKLHGHAPEDITLSENIRHDTRNLDLSQVLK